MKYDIDLLENVQRLASKQVPGLSDLSYSERLRKLNLPTVKYKEDTQVIWLKFLRLYMVFTITK